MNKYIRQQLLSVEPDSQPRELLALAMSIASKQKAFDWMGWTFGNRVLKEPELVYQLSEANLVRLLTMLVRADRYVGGTFRRFCSNGLVNNTIERLRSFASPDSAKDRLVEFDPKFDPRADSPLNRDPDLHSPTLRSYHQLLWEKPLPNGEVLHLSKGETGKYLLHDSALGTFNFKSDAIDGSFYYVRKMDHIHEQLMPGEKENVFSKLRIPGSYTIFPGDRVPGVMTINQARGCSLKIVDRFDLTLECIRRFYYGLPSPLSSTLQAYSNFFDLFESFEGFVEFFLFQDLYDPEKQKIRFFLNFDASFPSKPYPKSEKEYRQYISASLDFCQRRTERMAKQFT